MANANFQAPQRGRRQLGKALPNQGAGSIMKGFVQGANAGEVQERSNKAADELNSFLQQNPEPQELAVKAQEIGRRYGIPEMQQKGEQIMQQVRQGQQIERGEQRIHSGRHQRQQEHLETQQLKAQGAVSSNLRDIRENNPDMPPSQAFDMAIEKTKEDASAYGIDPQVVDMATAQSTMKSLQQDDENSVRRIVGDQAVIEGPDGQVFARDIPGLKRQNAGGMGRFSGMFNNMPTSETSKNEEPQDNSWWPFYNGPQNDEQTQSVQQAGGPQNRRNRNQEQNQDDQNQVQLEEGMVRDEVIERMEQTAKEFEGSAMAMDKNLQEEVEKGRITPREAEIIRTRVPKLGRLHGRQYEPDEEDRADKVQRARQTEQIRNNDGAGSNPNTRNDVAPVPEQTDTGQQGPVKQSGGSSGMGAVFPQSWRKPISRFVEGAVNPQVKTGDSSGTMESMKQRYAQLRQEYPHEEAVQILENELENKLSPIEQRSLRGSYE